VKRRSTPRPIRSAAAYRYRVYSPNGLVAAGHGTGAPGRERGICDDFEGTSQRWLGHPDSMFQWERLASRVGRQSHPRVGLGRGKLGPVGSVGSYSGGQDARLISQPIRLAGSNDTLTFWQRYGAQMGSDGLSVEISTDAGATWTLLHPVPDYPFTDRWERDPGRLRPGKGALKRLQRNGPDRIPFPVHAAHLRGIPELCDRRRGGERRRDLWDDGR